MSRSLLRFALFLITLAFCVSGTALSQAPEPRPRIGLALSGGGARGIAHVGVLRALEDLNVPVDVIGGTSMGGIVAGLYASGLSPAEIESALREADWGEILRDKPPRRLLEFRRREDDRRYPFEIEMGIDRHGIDVPGGLLNDQVLEMLLRRHTLHAAGIDTFAQLPIPFLAVATDVGNGEAVVLEHGDLTRALRATSAIPVLFDPVEIDGRLLVDGGLNNNLPVDLVRELGADIVIAVDVSVPLEAVAEIRSLIQVWEQSIAILQRTRVGDQLARADIVVIPDLEGFSLFDYAPVGDLIARGETAALRSRAIAELAIDQRAYESYRDSHRRRPIPSSTIFDVQVSAPSWMNDRRIAQRVRTKPGDSLSATRIEEDALRLYALGEFERVGYDVAGGDDQTRVSIEADEKEWGPNYLDFGLRMVTDSGADEFRTGLVTFTGTVNLTRRRIGPRGAEWRNDLGFGQTNVAFSEFYQPLDFYGRWFIAFRARAESTQQSLFEGHRLIGEYGVDRTEIGVDFGRRLGLPAEVRVGLRRGHVNARVDAGTSDLPTYDVGQGAIYTQLVVDRVDDVAFPHEGVLLRLEAALSRKELGSHRSFDRLELDFKGFVTRDRHTAFGVVSGGSGLGSDLPEYDAYRLGGFLSLTGFGEGALRGAHAGVARAGYYYRLLSIPPASRALYLAIWGEAGNAWQRTTDIDFDSLLLTATVALGVDTGIGPVYLAYGAADEGEDRVYVALGPLF